MSFVVCSLSCGPRFDFLSSNYKVTLPRNGCGTTECISQQWCLCDTPQGRNKIRGALRIFENYFSTLFPFFFPLFIMIISLPLFPTVKMAAHFSNVQPSFTTFKKQFQSLFFVTIMIRIFCIMTFLYEGSYSLSSFFLLSIKHI